MTWDCLNPHENNTCGLPSNKLLFVLGFGTAAVGNTVPRGRNISAASISNACGRPSSSCSCQIYLQHNAVSFFPSFLHSFCHKPWTDLPFVLYLLNLADSAFYLKIAPQVEVLPFMFSTGWNKACRCFSKCLLWCLLQWPLKNNGQLNFIIAKKLIGFVKKGENLPMSGCAVVWRRRLLKLWEHAFSFGKYRWCRTTADRIGQRKQRLFQFLDVWLWDSNAFWCGQNTQISMMAGYLKQHQGTADDQVSCSVVFPPFPGSTFAISCSAVCWQLLTSLSYPKANLFHCCQSDQFHRQLAASFPFLWFFLHIHFFLSRQCPKRQDGPVKTGLGLGCWKCHIVYAQNGAGTVGTWSTCIRGRMVNCDEETFLSCCSAFFVDKLSRKDGIHGPCIHSMVAKLARLTFIFGFWIRRMCMASMQPCR